MSYNSRHVSTLFGVTVETIRNWSETFRSYLSPTANPGKNRPRLFTVSDMEVFSLIAQMRNDAMGFEDIHASLSNGLRGDPPELPPDEVEALVTGEHEKRLSLEIQYLQKALAKVQQERDEALGKVDQLLQLEKDSIKLQAELEYTKRLVGNSEQRVLELSEQLEKAQLEIKHLSEKVGESYVRGIMEALERKGDLPRRDQQNHNP